MKGYRPATAATVVPPFSLYWTFPRPVSLGSIFLSNILATTFYFHNRICVLSWNTTTPSIWALVFGGIFVFSRCLLCHCSLLIWPVPATFMRWLPLLHASGLWVFLHILFDTTPFFSLQMLLSDLHPVIGCYELGRSSYPVLVLQFLSRPDFCITWFTNALDIPSMLVYPGTPYGLWLSAVLLASFTSDSSSHHTYIVYLPGFIHPHFIRRFLHLILS